MIPALPPVGPVLRGKTRDVYDELISRLVEAHLPPGRPISISALARDLDVSPTPVREALLRLTERGLVTKEADRTFAAAPLLDREQQDALLVARSAVEPLLASLACRHATPDLVEELRSSVEAHRARANRSPDFARDRIASERFHEIIAAYAGNEFLYRVYSGLGSHVHRFRALRSNGQADALPALLEHQAILDAVIAGNEDGAANAMATHIHGMRHRLT